VPGGREGRVPFLRCQFVVQGGMRRPLRLVLAIVGALLCSATCHRARSDAKVSTKPPVAVRGVAVPPHKPGPIGPLIAMSPRIADLRAPPDVKAPPPGAKRTASGLAFKVLRRASGKQKPTLDDTVDVRYTGWTTDGRMFDSSLVRGQPAHFPVRGVIRGWTEGLQLMLVGEKRRFWIPPALAYGDSPGGRTPAGTLVFDIELLGVTALKVPEDVAAPPRGTKETMSGISYRVLKKGQGKAHPEPDNIVEIAYSGWTPAGRMFDSSVARGQPAVFLLNKVIPGWTESLQLMVVGEKARFWIPGSLAYDNSAVTGAPRGSLVFDIELLSIKEVSPGQNLARGDPD